MEEFKKQYKFIQGDCIEKLKELDDKSINIIVTSPPYSLAVTFFL